MKCDTKKLELFVTQDFIDFLNDIGKRFSAHCSEVGCENRNIVIQRKDGIVIQRKGGVSCIHIFSKLTKTYLPYNKIFLSLFISGRFFFVGFFEVGE